MKKKSSLKHTGAFWAFCAPCCILFGVFFLVPLVLSIAFSFTNYDGWKTIDFVGLTNYITLFKDSKFYLSLGRTCCTRSARCRSASSSRCWWRYCSAPSALPPRA